MSGISGNEWDIQSPAFTKKAIKVHKIERPFYV